MLGRGRKKIKDSKVTAGDEEGQGLWNRGRGRRELWKDGDSELSRFDGAAHG